jgi:hypothetical protein
MMVTQLVRNVLTMSLLRLARGFTMTGVIDMSDNSIGNLPVPADDHSAVNKNGLTTPLRKKVACQPLG